jgi:hypothetical protein
MFGKCIKVENGISFLLVIVFDVNMNREAVAQPQQKVNTISTDFEASPVIFFLLLIIKVLHIFFFLSL